MHLVVQLAAQRIVGWQQRCWMGPMMRLVCRLAPYF